jgi:CheY-like chemotaxis protein
VEKEKDAMPSVIAGACRILVVDEHCDTRSFLAEQLRTMGIDAVLAQDGVAGLSCIEESLHGVPISGIIMQLHTFAMDKSHAFGYLRRRLPDLPVMVIAGIDQIEDLRHAVTLGAREYVVKPFDSELLRRKCVRVFLGGVSKLGVGVRP